MTKSLADITKINYRYQRSARIDNDNSIENIKTLKSMSSKMSARSGLAGKNPPGPIRCPSKRILCKQIPLYLRH